MSDTIIKVERVSKKYCRSLKHTMLYGATDLARSFFGVDQQTERLRDGEFWAVNDISFEVKQGEAVGIIGQNGSGKSTLLKMLNGIIMPDKGKIEITGKVGALIEVGAGFHPMLTGRENVYINGAILGMNKKEIDKKFDEIIDFAGIGEFIDSPVKHYSSGMYVRLGFAIAAHAEPDILLVDEALAVGDEAFQRKCYSWIHAARKKGVTVVFVSHAASSILELCDRAMLFDQGNLLLTGSPKSLISRYHKLIYAPKDKVNSVRNDIRKFSESTEENTGCASSGLPLIDGVTYDPDLVPESTVYYEEHGARIENPRITTLNGELVNVLSRGGEYIYTYDVRFSEDVSSVRFGMMIKTTTGFEMGGIVSHTPADAIETVKKGDVLSPLFRFRCVLLPGVYFLNSGVMGIIGGRETFLHRCIDLASFRVQSEIDLTGTGFIDFS